MTPRRLRASSALVAGAVALTLAACGSDDTSSTAAAGNGAAAADTASISWDGATAAAQNGGMSALVAAAKKEGALNVIALPKDWANYGKIITAFSQKYGIKVNSANPDGSSQEEITAVKQLGKQDRAPDVLDVGQSFADANAPLFAPYEVATWDTIPDANRGPQGGWVNDYGGYVSIGCNAKAVPNCPTSLKQLADPAYKGKVALNGDPTQAAAAFAGVWAASMANGGSLDDIGPGVDFFAKLKKQGNLLSNDVTPATVQSGETPIVIDWDYNNVAQATQAKARFDFKVAVPTDAQFAQFYVQAINENAPHPAAARLWEEFLFSDEGQNLWLQGGSRPVRLPAMQKAGTADKAALKALPAVDGTPTYPTEAQNTAAQQKLAEQWSQKMS
jgi:putative spermidine/putrescine transport system substrate-binding protein